MKFPKASFLLFFLTLACSKPSTQVPHETDLKGKLNDYLIETVDRLNITGLSVAITRNDSVIYESAFGFGNIETKERLTPNHVFHWASVSKTFVATAVM
jgi:CubicO group peptidase (beta-lactamase class C family)